MLIVPPIIPFLITFGLVTIVIAYFIIDPTKIRFVKGTHSWITFFLQVMIVLLQVTASVYFPLPVSYIIPIISIFGLLLFTAGVVLIIWAKITMGKIWGMPGKHDIKRQSELVIKGPYQFTRNPIYLGDVLMHFGIGFALLSPLFFLPIILVIIFTREIKKEEKLLKKYFGNEYRDYCARVPRFL